MAGKQVRLDDKEATEMLKVLCKSDLRKENGMVAFLIREEYKRRFGLAQVPPAVHPQTIISERG